MTFDKTTLLANLQDTLISTIKRASNNPACLIVVRGPQQGKRFELSGASMSLGRDAAADILIDDPKVSRQQAVIEQNGLLVRLVDGGSTNGTAINDQKLRGGDMAFLCRDDLIKVGDSVLKYLPRGELDVNFINALEHRADLDALTQIFNKAYVLETLETEFGKARFRHTELSLMMVDLDHFKQINDSLGHDAGDHVLIEVSQLLKTALVSQAGTLGRFGGEEFLVLLPGLPEADVFGLAEHIRGLVALTPLRYDKRVIRLTISIGVAAMTPDCRSARDLFKRADRAMYQAKSAGRNQVCRCPD
ncbi:MAG: diguanylate cyclase [Rhodoferax sp.]|jgi:diguanylate cyclase (GGDEF)-like protein|nr:diguanylate cyclase [Rhodoferax sp.]